MFDTPPLDLVHVLSLAEPIHYPSLLVHQSWGALVLLVMFVGSFVFADLIEALSLAVGIA